MGIDRAPPAEAGLMIHKFRMSGSPFSGRGARWKAYRCLFGDMAVHIPATVPHEVVDFPYRLNLPICENPSSLLVIRLAPLYPVRPLDVNPFCTSDFLVNAFTPFTHNGEEWRKERQPEGILIANLIISITWKTLKRYQVASEEKDMVCVLTAGK